MSCLMMIAKTSFVLFLAFLACSASSGQSVGSWKKGNVDDPYVQEIANFALSQLEKESNLSHKKKIVEVTDVNKQIVSGVKYNITMTLVSTNCEKGSQVQLEQCTAIPDQPQETCNVEVWERIWLKDRRVTNSECNTAANPNRPHLPAIAKRRIGGDDHDVGHMGMFKQFVKKYNKKYSNSREYYKRFKIFRKNMKKVKKMQESEQGTAIYGATIFSDLTEKEFRRNHLGVNPRLDKVGFQTEATIPNIAIPDEFDWRTYNAVTPVKNQGMCGSCWAFSVTGNIEGIWAKKNRNLLSLSEQELVDCDKLDAGCEGGFMTNAYTEIIKIGGLETETDYPYDGADEKCHVDKTKLRVKIGGYVNISQDETDMAKWLVQNGPISIGINANVMQFYFGGVSHPWKFLCNPNDIDHGVLIVGYGVTTSKVFNKTLPYWIIKNSWGTFWGEKGYYRVYRGDGTCGLNLMASSATL